MTGPASNPSDKSLSPAHARWNVCGVLLLAIFAGWGFFHRLGASNLTDWDEAWHAQVAGEILTTHDWLTLHDRGQPYFNKPPLSFWLRAIAFRVGGVNEASARFFSALFGWGSVMLTAVFFGKVLGRFTGLLAGFILCTSWLFTLYHAGRSGETDSTLIFFLGATVACLWKARQNLRWYYAAGLFTALGWMTKGSTAYLAWPIAIVGSQLASVSGKSRIPDFRYQISDFKSEIPNSESQISNLKSQILGLVLAFALTLPWQLMMLARHGRAFGRMFYIGEGALPAMQAIENHPGDHAFYLMVMHSFFEPWLVLAAGACGWIILRRKQMLPGLWWVIAWVIVALGACTFFATKMVWYSAPVLPAIAVLAAVAVVELGRRKFGWIVLALVAWFSVKYELGQNWMPHAKLMAASLTVMAIVALRLAPVSRSRWHPALAAACAVAPLCVQFSALRGVIDRGELVSDWTALGVDDEPWRELCARLDRELPGRPVVLVGFPIPLHPSAYFYLHHLKTAVPVESIDSKSAVQWIQSQPKAVFIARMEFDNSFRACGPLTDRVREGALTAWTSR